MARRATNVRRDRHDPEHPTVQIMARSGLDWIIVDLEHGPIDLTSAHAMITATAGTPCVPLARIAANEPWLAKAPMDIGALGINFPMICNRADAEKAVRSLRYPPKGDRFWGPFHAPFRWGVSMADYMAAADDDMICMITIEHADAVERIDEIMATPGIDVAVIGPGDLATSINKRGQIDDPQVLALMKRAHRRAGQCHDRSRLSGACARLRLVTVPTRHRRRVQGHQAIDGTA
jgi:4-hydroxy-2-oxoheptanedioate aldolase